MLSESLRFYGVVFKELCLDAFRIRNRFNKNIDITGKVVVMTGAHTGAGKVTARELARRGAKVIIGSPDVDKGNKAIEEIKAQYKDVNIQTIRLGLASLDSIRQFAKEVCEQESHIDILINNAYVAYCPKRRTAYGIEMNFGADYLGHFFLTHLLLNRLKAAPNNARIVNLTSMLHMRGKINFDDINLDEDYSPEVAYGQSTLANVLFTRELARKLSHTTNVCVYCVHAGGVLPSGQMIIRRPNFFRRFLLHMLTIDAELSAQTTLYCALEPSLSAESGHYYSNCKRVYNVWLNATDDATADRLWQLSNRLVRLEKHLILQ